MKRIIILVSCLVLVSVFAGGMYAKDAYISLANQKAYINDCSEKTGDKDTCSHLFDAADGEGFWKKDMQEIVQKSLMNEMEKEESSK